MKKTIDDEMIIEWLEDEGKTLYSYEELERLYEELLNETNGLIRVGSSVFQPGEVLRLIDPVAFRCAVSDWWTEDHEEIGDYYADKNDVEEAREALSEE